MTLEDLAAALGGTLRSFERVSWLDTRIGELRAVVIRRVRPLTHRVVFDVGVFAPTSP